MYKEEKVRNDEEKICRAEYRTVIAEKSEVTPCLLAGWHKGEGKAVTRRSEEIKNPIRDIRSARELASSLSTNEDARTDYRWNDGADSHSGHDCALHSRDDATQRVHWSL